MGAIKVAFADGRLSVLAGGLGDELCTGMGVLSSSFTLLALLSDVLRGLEPSPVFGECFRGFFFLFFAQDLGNFGETFGVVIGASELESSLKG